MKRKNINNLLWVVFALLFIAGCGPSGAIGTDATITPTGFAVDLLCNGAACGEDVAADAIIGVKIKPAVEASAFATVLSCDGADYPLTLAGQEAVEDSMLFSFTHAVIPQVRPCTLTVSFVDAVKSLYGDSATPATVDFTIACADSDDFSYAPTLEKCWRPALMEMGAVEPGGHNGNPVPKSIGLVKAPASETLTIRTNWEDLEAAGVTVEIRDGALQISTATGADLVQKSVIIYKSLSEPEMPNITVEVTDTGFDLRPILDFNGMPTGNYSTNEMYAIAVGDNANIADTCTFQVSAKGLPSSLGGNEAANETPALFGVNDWTGFKLAAIMQEAQQAVKNNTSITEAACGFETTDSPAVLTEKMNARTNAVKQSVSVNSIYDEVSSRKLGISGGVGAREFTYDSGFAMFDHVWQGKPAATTTIASDWFDVSNGTIVGFMYQSMEDSGAVIKGAPVDPFVPFTLIIEDIKIE